MIGNQELEAPSRMALAWQPHFSSANRRRWGCRPRQGGSAASSSSWEANAADIRRLAADGLASNCKPGDEDAQAALLHVLGDPDPAVRRPVALAMPDAHLAASLPYVAGDYMGEHWLATFALLALEA